MSWRNYLSQCEFNKDLNQVYEFGVYSCESMILLSQIFKEKNHPIGVMYGFDSFEGLPDEKAEPLFQQCWTEGNFSSKELFSENNIDDTVKHCYNIIADKIDKDTKLKLIKGFYEDSLTDQLAACMEPAVYCDLDCDLYSSTITALDFMIRNELLVKGSLVGFDDIGGVPAWEQCLYGQSKAWKEMRETWNIDAELLIQVGNCFPHVHQIWKIK